MLNEQTFQLLSAMRLNGFARALKEQLTNDDYQQLSFDERVSMLVDREHADREARKLTRRLQQARLRKRCCLSRYPTAFVPGSIVTPADDSLGLAHHLLAAER